MPASRDNSKIENCFLLDRHSEFLWPTLTLLFTTTKIAFTDKHHLLPSTFLTLMGEREGVRRGEKRGREREAVF
jgi:hypothetical protein